MPIQFDPAKDAKNRDKHGVSLAAAANFEWEEAVTWPDQRRKYGEPRFAGLGYIGHRLFKERITIRLSRDVVTQFRAAGVGWQTRMDLALRQYIAEHPIRP